MRRAGRSSTPRFALAVMTVLICGTIVKADVPFGNWGLLFSGSSTASPGQIGQAALVTAANDNMLIGIDFKWNGPAGTPTGVQTMLYNGNSYCSGWGLTINETTGQFGVLAGGVGFGFSNLVLTPGVWYHVAVFRQSGQFSGVAGGQPLTFAGQPTPNPLGVPSHCQTGEFTIIGSGSAPVYDSPVDVAFPRSTDPFNGEIDKATIFAGGVETLFTIEEGSGSTTTSTNGTVMTLKGSPQWVPHVTAPSNTSLTADRSTIWPPNNKMVPVTISIDASGSGPMTAEVVSVQSNESPPFQTSNEGPVGVPGSLTVNLQASRLGSGSGRVYTITVRVSNAAGSETRTVEVRVPHDQGK